MRGLTTGPETAEKVKTLAAAEPALLRRAALVLREEFSDRGLELGGGSGADLVEVAIDELRAGPRSPFGHAPRSENVRDLVIAALRRAAWRLRSSEGLALREAAGLASVETVLRELLAAPTK